MHLYFGESVLDFIIYLRLAKYWKYHHPLLKGGLEEAVKKSLLCIFSGMVRNPSEGTENIFGIEVMNHNLKVQQQ